MHICECIYVYLGRLGQTNSFQRRRLRRRRLYACTYTYAR